MNFIKKYKAYILGVYAFLILIHFVFKDLIFPLSVLFYATPLILIIGLGLFLSLLYYKDKTMFIILLSTSFLLIIHWFSVYYFFPEIRTNDKKTTSILFWNIAKNKNGFPLDIISEKSNVFPLEVLAFVEADKVSKDELKKFQKKFKNYDFQKLKGNMIFGVKGKIDSIIYKSASNAYKFNHIITTINNRRTSVLIVDVYASPFHSREEALKAIIDYANNKRIDFIVGDFNTPYESVYFERYKSNFNPLHNYTEGFTATWPNGIPLLELDQIWISKTNLPIRLNKFQHPFSDHKLLIAEYELE